MGIWIILTVGMLLAGGFVLAICSVAARPIPPSEIACDNRHIYVNSGTEMQAPQAIKLAQMTALTVLLAVLTTSCAVTSPSNSVNKGSSEPVKGATLLMDHTR